MRDELVTLFTAGHETTALTLAYSLYLLADRPEIQDRLRAEIEALAPGRALTAADAMSNLPYCTAVIRESMRIYPPAWIIGREALRDCRVGPYRIKRGEQLLIAPYTLHRNTDFFPDPEAFRPERWLSEDAQAPGDAPESTALYERLPRYVYLPFGGGPRICVGNHFAMMEAVLILGTLVRSKRFARSAANDRPLRFFSGGHPATDRRNAAARFGLKQPVSTRTGALITDNALPFVVVAISAGTDRFSARESRFDRKIRRAIPANRPKRFWKAPPTGDCRPTTNDCRLKNGRLRHHRGPRDFLDSLDSLDERD